MKNQLSIISEEDISSKIYLIRGKEVMLDSDLAILYECTNGTKDINKAVKRNNDRFPDDFYFQLTEEECLRFQNGTLNKSGNLRGQHIKYLPHAFTEQGVAMLSSVLKTDVASEVSVRIMRAFVAMRHIIKDNMDLLSLNDKVDRINAKLIEHDSLFQDIFNNYSLRTNKIYLEGSTYDAYSFLLDIFNNTNKELIIVDNYINKEIFDIISKININIIIVSKNIDSELIKKYNSQYNNITYINDDSFHDRFLLVDKKYLYVLGSSIKDIGRKTTSIMYIRDEEEKNKILKRIDSLINNGK